MPFHPLWLLVILVIVLIIFGPKRLPELGSAMGRAMREFRKASEEIREEVNKTTGSSGPDVPAGPSDQSASEH